MMALERYVNKHLKSKHIKVKVVVIPTSRKHLIPYLIQGYGDIVAGNVTITEERKKLVDFSDPLLKNVEEIVVSSAEIPRFATIFDLSGRDIYVRKSSSYYESLQKLNATLLSLNKKPVSLQIADEYLEDEDLLEMMNAGLLPMIVMDAHKANFWKKIFPEIKVQSQLKLRIGGKIALAVRKNSPELLYVLNGFVKENKKGTLHGNMLFKKYLVNSNYLKNNLDPDTQLKYKETYDLFKKYGRKYDWPHLLLIALAYQESGLDQKKRSRSGAVGIMQVLPKTAEDKNVAIKNIEKLENNIHAGAKYLRFIKSRYFANKSMDELNSNLFAIAAYNAGPARITKLQKEAAEKGLDPNVWFNNVEVIASNRIGRETVQYVGNIYKYYIVYKHIVKQRRVKEIGKQLLESHYRGK
jgi:membrane-bound lytic murein transglycosylase MltF